MQNPSQEPLASSKAPNYDLKDIDGFCTFKIRIESQNLDHRYIKDQWPYLNQDQDAKPQSGTSSMLESPKLGLNPWFTGLWFALLFTGGGWITRHPLMGAGRVMVDFFQFIPYCMCQMQVHANFWVPELKNTGFGAVLLFWQNHMSKILWFWIERIKTALNFLKMHQICWKRS